MGEWSAVMPATAETQDIANKVSIYNTKVYYFSNTDTVISNSTST